jgi:hypothetical protein
MGKMRKKGRNFDLLEVFNILRDGIPDAKLVSARLQQAIK